jgi:hypothetical protein
MEYGKAPFSGLGVKKQRGAGGEYMEIREEPWVSTWRIGFVFHSNLNTFVYTNYKKHGTFYKNRCYP